MGKVNQNLNKNWRGGDDVGGPKKLYIWCVWINLFWVLL